MVTNRLTIFAICSVEPPKPFLSVHLRITPTFCASEADATFRKILLLMWLAWVLVARLAGQIRAGMRWGAYKKNSKTPCSISRLGTCTRCGGRFFKPLSLFVAMAFRRLVRKDALVLLNALSVAADTKSVKSLRIEVEQRSRWTARWL